MPVKLLLLLSVSCLTCYFVLTCALIRDQFCRIVFHAKLLKYFLIEEIHWWNFLNLWFTPTPKKYKTCQPHQHEAFASMRYQSTNICLHWKLIPYTLNFTTEKT